MTYAAVYNAFFKERIDNDYFISTFLSSIPIQAMAKKDVGPFN
jgi:hypothetical protein